MTGENAMPFATVGDVKINYEVQGEGDWLVLVGGYASGNWQAWGAQLTELAKSFRVLAFDNRGIGESDVPDYPYTTLMMARDTLGLMDHLGIERAHVFGKSLGGNIAQWMALEQPQKVRSAVMTSTFAKPDQRRANMVRWWMATAEGAGYDKLFPGLMTYFYTAEFYDANIASIERTVQALIAAKRPIKGFLHMGDSILTHDTMDRMGEIKVPCLLMGGADDIITPARQMEEMGRRIPNAEVRIFPSTLHGFMVERPDAFNMIVEFLKRH
jgi:pimeloyl-ACP methyl ester carboxylesterase